MFCLGALGLAKTCCKSSPHPSGSEALSRRSPPHCTLCVESGGKCMKNKNWGMVAALKATLNAAELAASEPATTLIKVALGQLASLEAVVLAEEPAPVVVPPAAAPVPAAPAPTPVVAQPVANHKKAAQVEACYHEDRQQQAATQPKQQGPKKPVLNSGVAGARKPQAPAKAQAPAKKAPTEAELVEAAKAAKTKLDQAKVEAKAPVAKAGQAAVEKAEAQAKSAQADLAKAEAEAGKAKADLAEAKARPDLADFHQVGGFANLASAKERALALAQKAAQDRATLAQYWASPEGQATATAKAKKVAADDLQPARDRLATACSAVAAYRANQKRLAEATKAGMFTSFGDMAAATKAGQ